MENTKRFIEQNKVEEYLFKGYKLGSTSWHKNEWIMYNNKGHCIKDELGQTYDLQDILSQTNHFYIVTEPAGYTYDPDWIQRMYELYSEEYKTDKVTSLVIGEKSEKFVVIDRITGKTGIARCHPNDRFDAKLGAVVAYSRLRGMTPKFKQSGKCIKELKGAKIKYWDREWWVVPTSRIVNGVEKYILVSTTDDILHTGFIYYTRSILLSADTIIFENNICTPAPEVYNFTT